MRIYRSTNTTKRKIMCENGYTLVIYLMIPLTYKVNY